MTPQDLRSRLQGVIAFPVTPFEQSLALDLDALRKNVAHLMRFPLSALVAAGGTGELYSLTPDEHRQVVGAVVAEVHGRVPVIAGVGFGHQLAADLARQAAAAGADGILAFPPYYPGAADEGLYEYYAAIGRATSLGLLIYSRDWAQFSPAAVQRLCAIPTLMAWKDGQGDLRRLQMIKDRVGDRLLWIGGVGDDLVPGYYAMGIRTYTSSIANLAPGLSCKLHEYGASGDSARLAHLMSEYVVPLYEMRARRKGYEVSIMKEAMTLLGMPAGPVRPPLAQVRPEEIEELRLMMKKWREVL